MAGERHGFASEAFTDEEQTAILSVADKTRVYILHKGYDNEFMGRLVRFLMYTGVHISVLPKLKASNIEETVEEGGTRRLFLTYRRPKKKKDNVVKMPVSRRLLPWVYDFLNQEKPKSRVRYNQILMNLQAEMEKQGYRIHLNPHRFRHTCMRILTHEGAQTLEDVERITGTTAKTLARYAKRSLGEIADDLSAKGW